MEDGSEIRKERKFFVSFSWCSGPDKIVQLDWVQISGGWGQWCGGKGLEYLTRRDLQNWICCERPRDSFQPRLSNHSNQTESDKRDHVLPDYYSRPSNMTSSSSLTGFMSDTFSSSFLLWASQGTTPQTFPTNLKFVKSFLFDVGVAVPWRV